MVKRRPHRQHGRVVGHELPNLRTINIYSLVQRKMFGRRRFSPARSTPFDVPGGQTKSLDVTWRHTLICGYHLLSQETKNIIQHPYSHFLRGQDARILWALARFFV